jgi:hypothetical protein
MEAERNPVEKIPPGRQPLFGENVVVRDHPLIARIRRAMGPAALPAVVIIPLPDSQRGQAIKLAYEIAPPRLLTGLVFEDG